MFLNNICSNIAAMAICAVAALAVSCEGLAGKSDSSLELNVVNTSLSADGSKQLASVSSNIEWTIELSSDWLDCDMMCGRGDASLVISCPANNTGSMRSCTLTISGSGLEKTVVFNQASKGQGGGFYSDPFTDWLELPAVDERDGLYFISHRMSVGKYNSRNYSYYYDTEALLSRWVAYPLNSSLIGSGSRTDQWGLDPRVPVKYQPVLFKAFKGGYDRGHQLPSADRLSRSENVTTFYSTNMTPQKGSLNQESWAELEGMVRNWAARFDTLYVVTGADIKGSKSYAYDNDGKAVTVPVGYFKALLGYKSKGNIAGSSAMGGYSAIGFYFEHKAYSSVMPQSMSIEELEKKTGWDFFVNLEAKIGTEKYRKVETTVDSWWKNN